MKRLVVNRLSVEEAAPNLADIKDLLQQRERHAIDEINWEVFLYRPKVTFAVAYTKHEFFVDFEVEERRILAEKTEPNSLVCQDSCVEMFFAPRPGRYINLEFNCIGTLFVGSCSCREDITPLRPDRLEVIRRHGTLGELPFTEKDADGPWSLTAAIPLTLLQVTSEILSGSRYRANFQKCGDNLSCPHYLSWNRINTPGPDFHQPEYFGELIFA